MRETRILKSAVALPLATALVACTAAGVWSENSKPVSLLLLAGAPYALSGLLALLWLRGRSEEAHHRLAVLAPVLLVPALASGLIARYLGGMTLTVADVAAVSTWSYAFFVAFGYTYLAGVLLIVLSANPLEGAGVVRTRRQYVAAACAGGVPLLALALIYTFVLAARLTLGYWPSNNNPDPSRISALFPLDVAATLTFLVAWLSPIVSLPLLVASVVPPLQSLRLPAASILGSWGVFACLFYFDPGGFIGWLLD